MIEAPAEPGIGAATEQATPAPTVAEHAAQFSPEAIKAEREAPGTISEEDSSEEAITPQQRRDGQTGQFRQGRHRAKSQQASPADVPRIQNLTARNKQLQDEIDALKAPRTSAVATVHAVPPSVVPTVERRSAPAQPQARPAADPEPTEDDAAFDGDYGKYLIAQTRWAARDEYRQQQERGQQAKAHHERMTSWGDRVSAAKAEYPDFEAVAFAQTAIPNGSVPDLWIMEHPTGAKVLYHLQSHPQELDSLLRMPVLAQVEHLTLLSQRWLSSSSAQAGATGSAARPSVVPAPRPPNPVRTGPTRTGDDGPPSDRPLTVAEHSKYFGRK